MAHKFFEFVLVNVIMFSLFLSCLSMSTRLKIYKKFSLLHRNWHINLAKICIFQLKFAVFNLSLADVAGFEPANPPTHSRGG